MYKAVDSGGKIFVPSLTYGHEPWIVTERLRLWTQEVVMSSLWRMAELSLSSLPHRQAPGEVIRASYYDAS